MFKIIDKTIHLTRGDAVTIRIGSKNNDGTDYTFKVGDVVRLNVFKRKDCGCIELTKDITVDKEGTTVDIPLTSKETTIGGIINKPTVYWYEIILDPNGVEQTILGYDLDGEKEFILYPEGNEVE